MFSRFCSILNAKVGEKSVFRSVKMSVETASAKHVKNEGDRHEVFQQGTEATR